MRALRDFVIVKNLEEKEQRTASGLFVPGTNETKYVVAEVVSVGSGVLTSSGTLIPIGVNVGEKVMYSRSVGVEIKVENETYTVLREDSLYVVL